VVADPLATEHLVTERNVVQKMGWYRKITGTRKRLAQTLGWQENIVGTTHHSRNY
jgi:hypothetical protein